MPRMIRGSLGLLLAAAVLAGCASAPTQTTRPPDRCRVTSPAQEQVALFYIFCYNHP